MSLFGKLFGRKKDAPKEQSALPSAPAGEPSKNKDLIRVFDSYGRELFISHKEWRQSVLLPNLKKVWNQPDQLYSMIISALNDGFRSDIVPAAAQLHRIDPNLSRGACIWGIVLMEEGRLDEAEKVFREHIAKQGEEGVILTNLAKVYSRREDHARGEKTLWHALELDPNQDNGLGWYEVIHRERGGEAAGQEALRRIAAIPGSWRAQLWLARTALQSRQLASALAYYRESLSHVGQPVPADLLVQMSGDLGNAGHLPELVNLTEPHFDPAVHGLQVGNNLIKAYLDLGQVEAARHIVDQLYALQRPDWRDTLSYWDTEIAKARLATVPSQSSSPPQVAMLAIEGPVWLRPSSPAAELFAAKLQNGPRICLLGSSMEIASNSQRIEPQISDAPGRLTRALPLFLAEQIDFGTSARVVTLVPWIASGVGGFVVSGRTWSDDAAAAHARQEGLSNDYAVTMHLKAQSEQWMVEVRLIRTLDAKCLTELSASFLPSTPQQAITDLARRLVGSIVEQTEVQTLPVPAAYRVPAAGHLTNYLLRLEQLLAVRCAAMDGVNPNFLNGEREILNGDLELCLACSDNLPARLLLLQTAVAMKKARPDILPEFKEKLSRLQQEHPIAEPANSILQRLITETFGT